MTTKKFLVTLCFQNTSKKTSILKTIKIADYNSVDRWLEIGDWQHHIPKDFYGANDIVTVALMFYHPICED